MIKKIFPAFGTLNSITLPEEGDASVLEQVKGRLLQMHDRFSLFRPDSEICQINAGAGVHPVPVSEDTFFLLSRALHYARDTEGAFDVTAGAASQLWKKAIRSATLPPEGQVERCRALCGMEHLELDALHQTAFLRREGMKIDLGGIVKGYAADEARRMLRERGVENACINLGGTVAVMGKKQNIGIQNPFRETGRAMAWLPLQNQAVVTSGSYEQCFFHQGTRFHHIIDPRTGRPSRSDLVSVSLIGEEAAALDGLATGMCCLGQEAGARLARKYGISAIFVTADGGVQVTPELQSRLSFDPLRGQHTLSSRRSLS